jgi:carboxypeptidase Taq
VPDALAQLKSRLKDISDLGMAGRLLEWDQLVMMPPTGGEGRADHVATVQRIAHELFIDDAVGELLEAVRPLESSLDPESDDACLIAVTRTDWAKARRIPAELQAELSRHSSASVDAWVVARQNSDFTSFRPWLDRTLELKHEYIVCFDPIEPYDALLDDFEPGMQTSEVRRVFSRLEPELRALVEAAPPEDDEPFVRSHYPRPAQEELSFEIVRAFGLGEGSFRLDPTVHPFCLSLGSRDIRLTTRYAEDDLAGTSLFSTMHEAGHGAYEHGISATLDGTPLASGCSSILHESQSRLWENVIGRSLPFWRWFYPRVQEAFPAALAGVGLERFHRAVNLVRPSLIRVDADETTYGLHIILRFELEQALLFGGLATSDLPEAWNARMRDLLGIDVPDDARGCLQDVHWAAGMFGYFPTYQLGNVVAAQIWERLLVDVPDAYDQIEQGRFDEIQTWLRDRLYALGRKFTPAETIARVAGGPIDPEPYLAYLRDKSAALARA